MTKNLTAQATAFSAATLLAFGLTMASTDTAEAGKTGNFLLGAAAGVAGAAIVHGLAKRRRQRVYVSPAPRRRYYKPRRRYYKPRALPNPEVSRIQESLNILGFNVGAVDGVSGRGTRAGISGFQASIQQPATGYMTEMQKAVLFQKAQARMTGQPAYPAPAPAAAPGYPAAPPAPAPVAAPGYNPYNAPAQPPAAAPIPVAPVPAAPAPAYNPYNAAPAPAAPIPAAPVPGRQ